MAFPSITQLPEAPNRQSNNSTEFSNNTDAFLNALITFGDEVNTAGDYFDSIIDEAETQANAASASASAAATSETNAAASESSVAANALAATTAASNAATSETNAATSESNAAASALAASNSEAAAEDSADTAAASELVAITNATTSTSNAASALASKNSAATSETNAAASATSAANSAANAALQLGSYKGDWEAGVYELGDSVTYTDGYIYIAKNDTSAEPSDSNNWMQGTGELATYSMEDVEDILNESQPANIQWDVEIPFNDGISIPRGYGTNDQIDVSAAQDESILVDLPSKSVDFSRASSTGSTNKSGVLEELESDVPMIGADGLGIYGTYTNQNAYSESFDNSSYIRGGILSVTQDGTTLPNSTVQPWLVIEDTSTGVHRLERRYYANAGDLVSISAIIKTIGSNPYFRFECSRQDELSAVIIYDLFNEEIYENVGGRADDATIELIGDGFYRCSIYFYVENDNTDRAFYLYSMPTPINSWTGDGVSGAYMTQLQAVTNMKNAPYIKTEATEVTRAPDIASIPMENNMPAAGEPFTIIIDAAVPLSDSTHNILRTSNSGSTTNNITLWRFSSANTVAFRLRNESGTEQSVQTSSVDDAVHRYSFRFTGTEISVFVDGSIQNTATCLGSTLNPDDDINIGGTFGGAGSLNSSIKNFRIVHQALTDKQIAALGSAE